MIKLALLTLVSSGVGWGTVWVLQRCKALRNKELQNLESDIAAAHGDYRAELMGCVDSIEDFYNMGRLLVVCAFALIILLLWSTFV